MIEWGELPRAVQAMAESREYNDMVYGAEEAAAGAPPQEAEVRSMWTEEERQAVGEGQQERLQEARSRSDMLENPLNVTEAYLTSWKSLLARNLGRRVVVSFLMGTQKTVVARGILYEIGSDYIVLYQPEQDSYITADLYSVKFVEFRVADQRNTISSMQ